MRDLEPDDDLLLLSCAEMGLADAGAIDAGIRGTSLMEAAGRAVAETVMRGFRRQPVLVLCGPGNNGGDGYVTARHLRSAGWSVRLAALSDRGMLRGDAAWAASTWDGPVGRLGLDCLRDHPLVVDALFGAGLARPLAGAAREIIEALNRMQATVIAVDVPSGLHGDTGQVLGTAPVASHTVTFVRAKPGHFGVEGLKHCGRLVVADIGTPASVVASLGARLWLNAPSLWANLLKRDGLSDHKYARGHLTILGGAAATGAARMAALAARRIGAGLVTIAAPAAALPLYQAAEPGNLIREADDGEGFASLLADARRNAVLAGPGSGLDRRTRESVLAALATGRATVLDADAISVFAPDREALFGAIGGPTLLTPHEGEFKRLFADLLDVPGKVERTRRAARLSGATVLLKGPDTVIATPDGRAVVNVHASPALATAGSGDVLAGLAAGLMSQGISPFASAAAAAWLHGECARGYGLPGMIAEDLIGRVPHALAVAAGRDPHVN
ncbi:MAG: NAD(P)H-hydrate dehydratase [Reyranellaceae bacterium]